MSGGEEDTGAGGRPATVCQVLRVRAGQGPGSCYCVPVEDLVHMMALSLMSSDQILAHQSPTVKKF